MGAIHLSTAFLETDLFDCPQPQSDHKLARCVQQQHVGGDQKHPTSIRQRQIGGAENRLGRTPIHHQCLQCQHTGQRQVAVAGETAVERRAALGASMEHIEELEQDKGRNASVGA